ncbi:MAG TPA: PcfB family protein [Syntrophomonas sp.]|nr:PcfB family protein [Syntrophomonas sp.]
MQEDIERRAVAISVNAAKLSAKTLAKALAAVLRKIQKEYHKAQTPQGKQSVKKLMNHRVATNALPLDEETKLFDRVARKYNVDYAFHKTGPRKYLLFFKSAQADAITAAFSEYTKLVLGRGKSKRPSILQQLKQFGERARSRPREQELKREVAHEDR